MAFQLINELLLQGCSGTVARAADINHSKTVQLENLYWCQFSELLICGFYLLLVFTDTVTVQILFMWNTSA